MKDVALVYMAGGVSNRFGGKIKQLAKVGPNGESLIEYSLNQALPAGFSKVIFIVGEKTAQPIRELIRDNYRGINVHYAFQKFNTNERDKPWGTVDALCAARGLIDCSFVVCNGDDIYGKKPFETLVDHLEKFAKINKSEELQTSLTRNLKIPLEKTNYSNFSLNRKEDGATLAYKLINVLPENGLANRGIFKIGKDNYVQSIKEVFNIDRNNFAASGTKEGDLCSQNIWALQPNSIEMLYFILREFKDKNKGDRKVECLLPNEISSLVEAGRIKIKAYYTEEKCLGVTHPGDEERVRKELIMDIPDN